MDTMSTGAVVALAMDLQRRGIADLGLRFGDVESYLAAPELICERRGAGAELALGARSLAELYGHPELAAHVKGMDLPGYDPRGSYGMGLAYATSDRGACHMRAFPATDEILLGSRPPDSLDGKAELVVSLQDFCSVSWTGIWCSNWATDAGILIAQFSHLWQRAVDEAELMRVGARIWNLARLINVREGYDSGDDRLPPRILSEPHPDGGAAGRVIGEAAFDAALSEYYAIRGWTERGVPRDETLARLGVDVRLPEIPGDTGAKGIAPE